MRIIIIIFKYKPIENAQSNGVDRTQIIICVNNPFKSIVQLLLLLIRRRERLWSNILLWVGSAFELYEWLENLGTVPLQMRSHISSRKRYDLLYKPLHCIHTHTHTPRYAENTKQPRRAPDFRYSNPKNDLFFLANHLLHHKQRV